MLKTKPPELASVPTAKPSPILRLGKDEMNLAEFPITLLTDRVPKDQKVIEYQDQIFDEKSSRTITRKLTISASEAYGLPTAIDDDVILALIQLTKTVSNFTSRKVEFSRLDLIRMLGWPDSGSSYKRVATSLKRWLGVSLVYENAWWDKRHNAWTTKGFHILDNFELNDSRAGGGQNDLFPSNILWNEAVFESFQAGFLKTIDYDMYMRLEHPTAKRLYRFLSKRMYHRPDWTFDLRDLAFEHIGLSRNYDGNAGKIKEKLQPALEELEAAAFLEPMSKDDRYQKEGRDWKIRLISSIKSPALAASHQADLPWADPAMLPLVSELVKRGVTEKIASELVEKHPAAVLEAKIEHFDWEMTQSKPPKRPAGYLVKSILDGYNPDPKFVSKAEREQRAQAARQAEQKAADDRRREREKEARDRAEKKTIAAYWDGLTPEQQAAHDAAAIAQASPDDLKLIQPGPVKKYGMAIIRDNYTRTLLHAQGLLTACDA